MEVKRGGRGKVAGHFAIDDTGDCAPTAVEEGGSRAFWLGVISLILSLSNATPIVMEEESSILDWINDNVDKEITDIVEVHDLEHEKNAKEVWEPKVDFIFDSEIEALQLYDSYVRTQDFAVICKTSKKVNEVKINNTVACNRCRTYKTIGSKLGNVPPTTKTDCPARMNISLMDNGKWRLNSFVMEHNHEMDLEAAKYMKCNQALKLHVQREIEFNRAAGIRMNATITSAVRQLEGHKNLGWIEKDAYNYLNNIRRHELEVRS
ncbi:hypothetical protein Droror1_Dr00026398 [Drosera rotundifolia]